MKHLTSKITIIITSMLLAASSWAGFDITRMTTVVDDLSGSYTVTKSGRLDEGQFTGSSVTEFNSFHPGKGENEAVISGVVSKNVSRAEGEINTSADGSFTLNSLKGDWEISFNGLSIAVTEEGVVLSGAVDANGDTYDVNDLPDAVAFILRRVFWLTRR
jgi:hypothetical protein